MALSQNWLQNVAVSLEPCFKFTHPAVFSCGHLFLMETKETKQMTAGDEREKRRSHVGLCRTAGR